MTSEDGAVAAGDELPQLFVRQLLQRYAGRPLAILMYGSWLRGKRDTMLDFYVILEHYSDLSHPLAALANRLLPPNVYSMAVDFAGTTETAKFATLTLDHLEAQIDRAFHSYFWSRWAQPMVSVHMRDEIIEQRLAALHRHAAFRVMNETLPLLPETFSTAQLWTTAFALTYPCELRSERAGRAAELAQAYQPWLGTQTRQVAAEAGLMETDGDRWRRGRPANAGAARLKWRLRRWLGKMLSVVRLLKAAVTFERPLDYVLWKVERHSGVREDASPLQRRYPLLFAWPVLWRLYRRGGFR